MSTKPIEFRSHLQSSLTSATRVAGREYLVAPATVMVAGVRNGDLISSQVIAHSHRQWNGRPLCMGHVYNELGLPQSANHPGTLEMVGLGSIWNASVVGGNSLKVECWFDTLRCQELGGDAMSVLSDVRSGKPTQVSVGFWGEASARRGVHEGVEFSSEILALAPDHLAVLGAGTPAACSWADGCGVPRVHAQQAPRPAGLPRPRVLVSEWEKSRAAATSGPLRRPEVLVNKRDRSPAA